MSTYPKVIEDFVNNFKKIIVLPLTYGQKCQAMSDLFKTLPQSYQSKIGSPLYLLPPYPISTIYETTSHYREKKLSSLKAQEIFPAEFFSLISDLSAQS